MEEKLIYDIHAMTVENNTLLKGLVVKVEKHEQRIEEVEKCVDTAKATLKYAAYGVSLVGVVGAWLIERYEVIKNLFK